MGPMSKKRIHEFQVQYYPMYIVRRPRLPCLFMVMGTATQVQTIGWIWQQHIGYFRMLSSGCFKFPSVIIRLCLTPASGLRIHFKSLIRISNHDRQFHVQAYNNLFINN